MGNKNVSTIHKLFEGKFPFNSANLSLDLSPTIVSLINKETNIRSALIIASYINRSFTFSNLRKGNRWAGAAFFVLFLKKVNSESTPLPLRKPLVTYHSKKATK